MSAEARLQAALRAVRLRSAASAGLAASPLVLATAAVAWRVGGPAPAFAAAAAALAAACAYATWRARRIDARWLARRLDARRADLDDSAALLFADAAALAPLQRLQRERLRRRIADGPMPDLRPPWRWRRVAAAAGLAALVVAAALLWPGGGATQGGLRPVAAGGAAAAGVPRLVAHRLHVVPPAYTGVPAHDAEGLEVGAPEGARLEWTLRFEPQPAEAELVFHDGLRIPLEPGDEGWTASHTLERSALYRIVPAGAPAQPAPPLHRLDAIADGAPSVRVLAPERNLSLLAPGQREWALSFEASDDYGLAADARLHLTLAQGSGENITFSERTLSLRGQGGPLRKRYQVRLDPVALGLARGEDLIAQLEVRDNRVPRPQPARSASLILRWPSEPPPDTAGLDLLARQVLPAYFRSQRQIIIDAEALLEEKPALDEARFLDRSDAIGVDQRLLRLRYGQFLGEEAEGAARPPPTHDAEDAPAAPALPIDDYGQAPAAPVDSREHAHADAQRSPHDHDHDHGDGDDAEAEAGVVFGSVAGVLEQYGHLHDLPEAATLLDPRTREILRRALREMWQSELGLRQGDPARALPYAYRALDLIQEIRQADRIYLARVGSVLPPIDESRRLGGERAGIARRPLPPSQRTVDDGAPIEAWRALAGLPGRAPADLDALERWLRDHGTRGGDPLALAAAIDALRNRPGCEPCRRELRALLWTALERPVSRVQRRDLRDAEGGRYLDALEPEDGR